MADDKLYYSQEIDRRSRESSGPLTYVYSTPTNRHSDRPQRQVVVSPLSRAPLHNPHSSFPYRVAQRTPLPRAAPSEPFDRRSNRPALSDMEANYFRSVDVSLPLLRNLRNSFTENSVDMGKLGLILFKYESAQALDQAAYDECVAALAPHSFSIDKCVSIFGELSPKVFQSASAFLTNLSEKKTRNETVKEGMQKLEHFNWKPKFQFISMNFSGTSPFKKNHIVCLQFGEQVPTQTQRAVYWVLKYVLADILEDPTGHQRFAIRAKDGRNAKTKYLDLPEDVKLFVEDFCLESFGYPRSLRFPSYSLESLSIDKPEIAARLGSDEKQRRKNYEKLLKDVQTFHQIIFTKFQRIFSDFRNHHVKEIVWNTGVELMKRREFVSASSQEQEQPTNLLEQFSERREHGRSESPRQIDDFEEHEDGYASR